MSLIVDIRKKLGAFELESKFEAQNGVTCLLGPSGCGKSMTLKCIAGIEKPDSGHIELDGVVLYDSEKGINLPPQKRHVGYLFQNYALFPNMTVRQNILCGMRREKDKAVKEEKLRQMVDMFQLGGLENHRPAQLSGGQAQRTALARIMVSDPQLLLLDEPFSALDAKIRQQMREELKKIQSDLGITVVFVTHDQEEAMSLSHRIVVMNKGKFEQIGTPTEIYDKPATRHVASFIGEMNFIDKDNKTIAVRPEDVTVSIDGTGDFTGTVRTIMVLGHYVVVNVQRGDNVIKCFVDRDISEKLSVGQTVGMHIGKHTVFDK